MSLVDLLVLYGIVGVALAIAVALREAPEQRFASAILTLVAWPLWAPVVLSVRGGSDAPRAPTGPASSAAERVRQALEEGVSACEGSALANLLPKDAQEHILREVVRVEGRREELERLLERVEYDLEAAELRVQALERGGADGRALAPARMHLANVRRLHGLRDHDAKVLSELADLIEALRTQLVLARYQGASAHGVGTVVSDMWTRVEALGEAMDLAPGEEGIEAQTRC